MIIKLVDVASMTNIIRRFISDNMGLSEIERQYKGAIPYFLPYKE
jgi:hypothetical protein